jgi:hypothetical protein
VETTIDLGILRCLGPPWQKLTSRSNNLVREKTNKGRSSEFAERTEPKFAHDNIGIGSKQMLPSCRGSCRYIH